MKPETIYVEACRLDKHPKVSPRIDELSAKTAENIGREALSRFHADILLADNPARKSMDFSETKTFDGDGVLLETKEQRTAVKKMDSARELAKMSGLYDETIAVDATLKIIFERPWKRNGNGNGKPAIEVSSA